MGRRLARQITYSKRTVTVGVKIFEVFVMLAGNGGASQRGQLKLVLVCVFFMGVQ